MAYSSRGYRPLVQRRRGDGRGGWSCSFCSKEGEGRKEEGGGAERERGRERLASREHK